MFSRRLRSYNQETKHGDRPAAPLPSLSAMLEPEVADHARYHALHPAELD
jgi:hypothetical protein